MYLVREIRGPFMLREERRSATAERITSGKLPRPRWISVHPGAPLTGRYDGCAEDIERRDYAFTVVLQDAITFHFHDECFEVYNRSSSVRDWPWPDSR